MLLWSNFAVYYKEDGVGDPLTFQVKLRRVAGETLPAITVYVLEEGFLATARVVLEEVQPKRTAGKSYSEAVIAYSHQVLGINIEPPPDVYVEVQGFEGLREAFLQALPVPASMPKLLPFRDLVVQKGLETVQAWLEENGYSLEKGGPYL